MAQKDAREYRDLSSSKIFNTRSSGVLLYSYVHHREQSVARCDKGVTYV